jgi:hypothetical protein
MKFNFVFVVVVAAAAEKESKPTKQKACPVQTTKQKTVQRPNVVTMLHYLQTSEKNGGEDDTTKPHQSTSENFEVQRTKIQDRLNVVASSRNMDISKTSSLMLEENFNSSEPMTSSSPLKRAHITEEPLLCGISLNEKLNRRRSKRLNARRSSIDFKACKQNFRKQKTSQPEPVIQDIPAEVPEQFSLIGNAPVDLISFVHDETEGLICTSQPEDEDKDGDCVFNLDDVSMNSVTNRNEAVSENEAVSVAAIAGDIDSGISDSEEVNDEQEEPEEHQRRHATTTVVTKQQPLSKITQRKLSRSISQSTTLNRSISNKKVRIFP